MLVALIEETLRLWAIAGSVDAGEGATAARIRTDSVLISIDSVSDRDLPFRWLVRWRAANETPPGARERHPRACASIVGVLAALRTALGIERGAAVRVAGAAPPARVAQAPSPAADVGSRRGACATPITVITGFLGSGKTTLLSRLLRDPAMGRTAVIVNEFGEIGLDHDLLEKSDESFVQLSNGCLCCKVRSDLVLTLADLAARRDAGTLPRFERVVIETTGLADPAPILHALQTDRAVNEAYAVDGVIATIDAVTGLQTLERYAESVRQAAIADCIVLTKTDVADADPTALGDAIAAINAEAPVVPVVGGAIDASALFGVLARTRVRPEAPRRAAYVPVSGHLHGIASIAFTRDDPLHAATLPLLLAALAENCGADLLRVKGIVAIAEAASTPAVIHGVQHVYHAPSWLERWPSADRRTRIVLIGRGLNPAWPSALLEAIEAEVTDQCVRSASGSTVA